MLLINYSLALILFYSSVVDSSCPNPEECLAKVRELISAPRRFWFGEQRSVHCASREVDHRDCHGPPTLAPYHSIGSRLFRVKSLHPAYLRNVVIYPRVIYRPQPGNYRACEHDFSIHTDQLIDVEPDMKAAHPFLIRKKPEINWKGLQYDQSLTILIVDAGFGTLNYMVNDFPKKPKTVVEYRLSDNYHSAPNALVVLAFKTENRPSPVLSSDFSPETLFDLPQFMLDNDLSDDLVGLSVIIVGSDAFAIERQRVSGNVDYCHSLLKKKLLHTVDEFYHRLPLHQLNSWLSVVYRQPAISANVCCRKMSLSAESHHLDPLGNSSISALATLYQPQLSSARVQSTNNFVNYHRHTRTFVALDDDLYSLILLDKDSEVLHWMLVDIPAAELNDISNKGITIANYVHPSPREPTNCTNFVFLLLVQPHSLADLEAYCQGICKRRKEFRIDFFMHQYGLRLSAASLMRVCYDLPYAVHALSQPHRGDRNGTMLHMDRTATRPDVMRERDSSRLSFIPPHLCRAFHLSNHKCPLVVTTSVNIASHHSALLILLLSAGIFLSFREISN